jgi:hypothetical protein
MPNDNAFCAGSNNKNKTEKMQIEKPHLKITCVNIEADLKADAGSKANESVCKADASKADADHEKHNPNASKIIHPLQI